MRGGLRLAAVERTVLFLGIFLAAEARAQEENARTQGPDSEEIVVTAPPTDRTLIDRETYIVRDTPLAQTKTATDVIQNLPSVSVDSSGQLRLLGNRNVKILIDGRDVPDASAYLGTLQASQIARIEVMTNPSAQFSAYGSAGIINIILRRRFADGLGGSGTVGAGNPGNVSAQLSPTWSNGTWSVSASPSLNTSETRTRFRLDRTAASAEPAASRIEDQSGRGRSRTAAGTGQVSFQRTPTERYDLTASVSRADLVATRSAQVSSPSGAFGPFVQGGGTRNALEFETVSIDRTATGGREGEEFKLSASWSHNLLSARNRFIDKSAAGPLQAEFGADFESANLGIKAGYTLPLRKSETLSVGAEIQRETQQAEYLATGELVTGPIGSDESFGGRYLDVSAFATLQTKLGRFKILPGLRVQRRRFEFDRASGVGPVEGTLLFPSLHVERPFGKVKTTFSVARRADWPAIGQFQPTRRVSAPGAIDVGNPALRPERTLNIEAGARMSVSGQDLSLKLYNRRRSSVRDTAIEIVENGDLLSRPINTGTRLSQGGQFSVRGRAGANWRHSLSAWIAKAEYNRFEVEGLVRERASEYGGNAQLEYSSGKQGRPGFDQATLNIRYQGPVRSYQVLISDLLTIDLDFTHQITHRLSVVATASRAFGDRVAVVERFGRNFRERTASDLYSPLFRVSLNYRFGTKG